MFKWLKRCEHDWKIIDKHYIKDQMFGTISKLILTDEIINLLKSKNITKEELLSTLTESNAVGIYILEECTKCHKHHEHVTYFDPVKEYINCSKTTYF